MRIETNGEEVREMVKIRTTIANNSLLGIWSSHAVLTVGARVRTEVAKWRTGERQTDRVTSSQPAA